MALLRLNDMVGNTNTLSILKKCIEKDAVPNFILFTGPVGTGKSNSATVTGMRLVCESPQGVDPCLACSSCKAIIKALSEPIGRTTNFVKYNLGMADTNKDLSEIVKEIFHLRNTYSNSVYIIEQLEILSHNNQSKFLEEIERLGSNSFLFAPTNKPRQLLRDIHSRALTLPFTKLDNSQMKYLLDRTAKVHNITKIPTEVEKLIIRYSQGTPRDMVKLVELMSKVTPTEEEMRTYLGKIDNAIFINLFNACKEGMLPLSKALSSLFDTKTASDIVFAGKEFLTNLCFYLSGSVNEDFTTQERKLIDVLFNLEQVKKTLMLFDKLNASSTEADVKLQMVKICITLSGSSVKEVIAESSQQASKQVMTASNNYASETLLEKELSGDSSELNLNQLKLFEKKGGN